MKIAALKIDGKISEDCAPSTQLKLMPGPSSVVTSPQYSDDCPVNARELAIAMRVSRWTVQRWVRDGYKFEFGRLTTSGHLKIWLRNRAANTLPEFDLAKKLSELD